MKFRSYFQRRISSNQSSVYQTVINENVVCGRSIFICHYCNTLPLFFVEMVSETGPFEGSPLSTTQGGKWNETVKVVPDTPKVPGESMARVANWTDMGRFAGTIADIKR